MLSLATRSVARSSTKPRRWQKTHAALRLDHGLVVILCVGEFLEEGEAGKTAQVRQEQLKPTLEVLKPEAWSVGHPQNPFGIDRRIVARSRC